MFIEHRTYSIYPTKLSKYLEIYGSQGWDTHGQHAPCLGHYYSELGQLNRVVSIWQYDSLEDRDARYAKLKSDQKWLATLEQLAPMVYEVQANVLKPSPFWKG